MTKTNILVLMLAFTVSLAANASLLAPYYFALDDYSQFDKSITDWFATRGIWRIVGIPLAGWLVSWHVYAIALIAAHAIGGYFFFLVARRGFGSVAQSLFLTIIVMAFPWGYEALVWASAAAYAFASCFLWVMLWALLSLRPDQRQIYVCAAGLLFASFLVLLVHEAVFFSLCVGGFVIWMRPDFWRDWKSAAAVSLAPLAGALLWGVTYELTKPAVPIFSVTRLSLRSALSPLFYQYRRFEVFDVWSNDLLGNYAISTIQSPNLILALLALCAVPFLVDAIMRAARVDSADTLRQQKIQIKPIAFLIWMVLVCEGAAFIYALAGGYSPDPRNSYIIMPMVIMSAAAAIWLISGPQRTRTFFWPHGSSVAISTICIFGCLTSLLVISIYKLEMKRVYLLADLIVRNTISGSFHPDGNPNLKAIWPSSHYDPQDALDRALDARGYERILLTPQSTERATWSMEDQRWYCCSVAETVGAQATGKHDVRATGR